MSKNTSRPLADDTGWLAFFLSASRNPGDPMRDVVMYFEELEKMVKQEASANEANAATFRPAFKLAAGII